MTLFGKVLTLLTFAFSMLVLGWSVMFYYTRIDWSDAPAQGDQPAGELVARKARVRELWDSYRPAESSWQEANAGILEREAARVADHKFYDAELAHAASGATDAKPAREPVFVDGRLVVAPVDPKNPRVVRPQVADAKDHRQLPLAALDWYLKEEQAKLAAVTGEKDKLVEAIIEEVELTNRLTPLTDLEIQQVRDRIKEFTDKDARFKRLAELPTGKGLRQRIGEEKVKLADVGKELDVLRPLKYTTLVESELLLKRRKMLEARIKELTDVGVAAKE